MEGRRCVLLVDDEQNILNSLGRELYEWAEERSLDVLTATSARRGLEVLAERGEDTVIVVSDLKMPEMKGSDFLLEVRKEYPKIVSILLTGFSEANEVVKAVQSGIFSYMLKPWDPDYLLAEVTKAFEYWEIRRQNEEYSRVLQEELKWAGELQRTILKPHIPSTEGIELRVSYRPVPGLYCGGDYYDVIFIGDDRYLLLIGDVAGHGVKAAFVTGILKAVIYPEYVRATIGRDFSPSDFLGWLNGRMNFELKSARSMIITFFAGVLDRRAAVFRYANAGHSHPFIVSRGAATELPASGPAFGFSKSADYSEQAVAVLPGDVIDLYTDGLVELHCADGCPPILLGPILDRVEYGDEYHRRIIDAALEESGQKDFTDDVTIVTAKVR